jgi:hypothetical protein
MVNENNMYDFIFRLVPLLLDPAVVDFKYHQDKSKL